MFDIEKNLNEQIQLLQKQKPTIIFAAALDRRVMLASFQLLRYAKIVLLANEENVKKYARQNCPELNDSQIDYIISHIKSVEIEKEIQLRDEFAQKYFTLSKDTKWEMSLTEAKKRVCTPPIFAIMATKLGYTDMVFGGLVYGPREFFRPALRILKKEGTPFEAGIFILPEGHTEGSYRQNIAIFSDIAVNASMTPSRLADIAVGTCKIARILIPVEVLPYINASIVSYSTKGLDEGPSVDLVRRASELIPSRLKKLCKQSGLYNSIRIDAEVQISCAVSREAALIKLGDAYRADSSLGKSNVLIAPNLDLGNFLYNSYATRYPKAKKFPVSGGLFNKIVDFSKESSAVDVTLGAKANILMLLYSGKWLVTPKDRFFPRYKILAINPGSTSTKFAYSEGDIEVYTQEIKHSREELEPFDGITDQYSYRKTKILQNLKDNNINLDTLDAVVGRGGLIWPVASGTYKVNAKMKEDLNSCVQGNHASNLGGLIASEIADMFNISAYIVDPVVVDEVKEEYKITGLKELKRNIISHALSQIATAKRFAEEVGRFYQEINVIVAHMGGGISIGAHYKGRYVDVNNALDGEGPFTPERSGSLPVGQLIQLCYSRRYSLKEMRLKNRGRGGLFDLLATTDFLKVEKKVLAGDAEYVKVFDAMAYQVARWITSLLPAFEGETVDQVLLTGGLARSKPFVERISRGIAALNVGVTVYPGENEMDALRNGALRVLMGKEEVKAYKGRQQLPAEY